MSKSHNNKEFDKMVGLARQHGFRIEYGMNNVKIFPPDPNAKFYTAHSGEKGIHPLRRYLRSLGVK